MHNDAQEPTATKLARRPRPKAGMELVVILLIAALGAGIVTWLVISRLHHDQLPWATESSSTH